MRLAIRRVYDFGAEKEIVGPTLLTPEAWDAVRRLPGAFELEDSRQAWLEAGAAEPYPSRATAAADVFRRLGAGSVCSHGVGTALLEQRLHVHEPELRLTCTDFAPETIARLTRLFDGVELVVSDLRDAASLPAADAHLMHRLDQELTREEWHDVFARLAAPVLFVPSEILTPRSAAKELARRVIRPRATNAGLFRNEAALRDLWSHWYDDDRVAFADEAAYLLTPRP